ncbi:MAG: hypothetical protein M1831_007327 [Alyxoria varia]|nr:MAG: hypothetical protein M1831_007327 [Alyxoria varia]
MLTPLVFVLAAAGITLAIPKAVAVPAPQANEGAANTVTHTVTFENWNGNSWGPNPDLPGLYDSLYWSNIRYGDFHYQSGLCAGVCPASFPAIATWDSSTQPASISSNYGGSQVQSYALESFWWGCESSKNVTTPSGGVWAPPTPANCTLTVEGYKDTAEQIPGSATHPDVKAVFEYAPELGINSHTSAPNAPMALVTLPGDFSGLKTVTFTASVPQPPFLTAGEYFLDNVTFTTTTGLVPPSYAP